MALIIPVKCKCLMCLIEYFMHKVCFIKCLYIICTVWSFVIYERPILGDHHKAHFVRFQWRRQISRKLPIFSSFHMKSAKFQEIHQFSWSLPIFSGFQHDNWQFSVKICGFHTDYWKDLCLGVFPSTSSRFHTENHQFSLKSTSFHENWCFIN